MTVDQTEKAPKRPVGLGALRQAKKQKEDEETQKQDTNTTMQQEDADQEQLTLRLPAGDDEFEDLKTIFQNALDNLGDLNQEAGMTWLKACVHESDRIAREQDEKDSLNLSEEFFKIFGDALYLLGTVEADNDPDIYKSKIELRKEHRDFVEAAIERYKLGLEIYPESCSLLLSLGKSQLRFQSIVHSWYLKKENYDPIDMLNTGLSTYQKAIQVIKERQVNLREKINLGWTLHEFVSFIDESELSAEFLSRALEYFSEVVQDILDAAEENEEHDELVYDSFHGMGACYLALGLQDLEAFNDDKAFYENLEKAEKILLKALEVAENCELSHKVEVLKLLGEVQLNIANHGSEDMQEHYYDLAVSNFRKCLDLEKDCLPEHLLEFMDDFTNQIEDQSEDSNA